MPRSPWPSSWAATSPPCNRTSFASSCAGSQAAPAADLALATGTRSLVGLFGRLRVETLAPEQWRALDPRGESLRDVDARDDLPSG